MGAGNRIKYLHQLHDEYNEELFDDQLFKITLLLKRQRTKDGWYEYRTNKGWLPNRRELPFAAIVIADGCFNEGTVEETLLHEMVHQYQAEILNEAPNHKESFEEWRDIILEKYDLDIK